MIDVRADSIIYQSQIYYRDLVNNLVLNKALGKALDSKWEKADTILGYLEAWNYVSRLTEDEDITDANYILFCLINLCELNQYPLAAPLTFSSPPSVLTGIPGADGDKGDKGDQGDTGLATDFQESLVSIPTIVDSFDITDAYGARWDYYIVNELGAQRVSSILGHWLPDGSASTLADAGTDDLDGTTTPLSFSIQISGTTVQLIATPLSNTWTVRGSRYFIPNNGNGTGPISDALLDGQVFIGNSSNIAQGRTLSGVITTTNTGVTSFVNGSIVNDDINSAAAIELSKLEPLTANRLLLSNGAGEIIASTVTNTEASYLSGVSSSIQTQLNTKLTDPTTTIGDLVIRNSSNLIARLGIGTANQVLTVVGGVPTWQTVSTATVAGANTEIQVNVAGVFGSFANFTFASNTLTTPALNISSAPSTGTSNTDLFLMRTSGGDLRTITNPATGGASTVMFNNLTADRLLLSDASGKIIVGSTGTAGQFLTLSGGLIPTWTSLIGLSDGDKGDITVSSSGTVWQLDPAVVEYSNIQNVGANRFLANVNGSPDVVQEIATSRIPLFGSSITGTPSTTTFLRGDGSWQTPSAAALADADYGDITVSGGGTILTVDSNINKTWLGNHIFFGTNFYLNRNGTGFNGSFNTSSITASRSYTIPNKDGTIALLSDINVLIRGSRVYNYGTTALTALGFNPPSIVAGSNDISAYSLIGSLAQRQAYCGFWNNTSTADWYAIEFSVMYGIASDATGTPDRYSIIIQSSPGNLFSSGVNNEGGTGGNVIKSSRGSELLHYTDFTVTVYLAPSTSKYFRFVFEALTSNMYLSDNVMIKAKTFRFETPPGSASPSTVTNTNPLT